MEFIGLLETIGAFVLACGLGLIVANLARSLWRGAPAGRDPWHGPTLEWATTSPPPPYNFETVPVTTSRRPLWDLKHPDDPDGPHE